MLNSVADPGFPGGSTPTYYFGIFSRKLHEIEKKLNREKEGTSLPPPWIRQWKFYQCLRRLTHHHKQPQYSRI